MMTICKIVDFEMSVKKLKLFEKLREADQKKILLNLLSNYHVFDACQIIRHMLQADPKKIGLLCKIISELDDLNIKVEILEAQDAKFINEFVKKYLKTKLDRSHLHEIIYHADENLKEALLAMPGIESAEIAIFIQEAYRLDLRDAFDNVLVGLYSHLNIEDCISLLTSLSIKEMARILSDIIESHGDEGVAYVARILHAFKFVERMDIFQLFDYEHTAQAEQILKKYIQEFGIDNKIMDIFNEMESSDLAKVLEKVFSPQELVKFLKKNKRKDSSLFESAAKNLSVMIYRDKEEGVNFFSNTIDIISKDSLGRLFDVMSKENTILSIKKHLQLHKNYRTKDTVKNLQDYAKIFNKMKNYAKLKEIFWSDCFDDNYRIIIMGQLDPDKKAMLIK